MNNFNSFLKLKCFNGANQYQWDNGVQNNVPFIPTASVTYTVIGTDLNGCVNTDVVADVKIPLCYFISQMAVCNAFSNLGIKRYPGYYLEF